MADLSTSAGGGGPEIFQDAVIAKACADVRKMLREKYYASWDTAHRYQELTDETGVPLLRPKLWYLYTEEATILWNGQAFSREELNTLLSQMPASKHTVSSLDVQPVQDANHAIVSIHGTCTYGDTITRSFHQQFVCVRDGEDDMRIMHDCFRWLAEEDERS